VLVLSQTPPTPTLTVTLAKGTPTVSWPANYTGWILQSSTNLTGHPAPWSTVPSSQYQTNGSVVSVTVTASGQQVFYRLYQ
jgi:hypothetical protein